MSIGEKVVKSIDWTSQWTQEGFQPTDPGSASLLPKPLMDQLQKWVQERLSGVEHDVIQRLELRITFGTTPRFSGIA